MANGMTEFRGKRSLEESERTNSLCGIKETLAGTAEEQFDRSSNL